MWYCYYVSVHETTLIDFKGEIFPYSLCGADDVFGNATRLGPTDVSLYSVTGYHFFFPIRIYN